MLLVTAIGTMVALLGFALVQAATACALVELDAGRPIGPMRAYRVALARTRPLLGALGIAVLAWVLLDATVALVPSRSGWRCARCCSLSPSCSRNGRRSAASVAASSSSAAAGSASPHWSASERSLTIAAGPLLGALLIFATDAPLALLNIVAGVFYALAMPFVALTTAYVYFDARVKFALAPRDEPVLPAEIEIEGAAAG